MKYILSPVLIMVLAICFLSTVAVAEENIYSQNDDTLLAPVQPRVSCSNQELIINDIVALGQNTSFGQGCIECGQICVLGGTPCCDPCTCKGKFPNTYCQQ
jgi:hypothetical protein